MSPASLYDGEEDEPAELIRDRWVEATISVCVFMTLLIGVYPGAMVGWARSGLSALGLG